LLLIGNIANPFRLKSLKVVERGSCTLPGQPVQSPRLTCPTNGFFGQQWHVPLHPSQDGRMNEGNAALGHHLDEVTGAELERQVPPDAQDDDFLVEMPTLEEILC
jgi:hypothetical protein